MADSTKTSVHISMLAGGTAAVKSSHVRSATNAWTRPV